MKVTAKVTNMPHAPRKVRPVIGLVRGRSVADALVILDHTPRAAAKDIAKLINSAKANAMNNFDLTEKSLTIDVIDVGVGQRLKRYRPASRGRALPYQKRSANVRVILDGSKKAAKAAAKKTDTQQAKKSDDKKATAEKPKAATATKTPAKKPAAKKKPATTKKGAK